MIEMGKAYMTRDGKYRTDNDTLRILMVDGGHSQPVLSAKKSIDGEWCTWWHTPDGRSVSRSVESPNDLIEIKPRRKGEVWVNCYGAQEVTRIGYDSREVADKCASPDRTACVRVEFEYEEGEGL